MIISLYYKTIELLLNLKGTLIEVYFVNTNFQLAAIVCYFAQFYFIYDYVQINKNI